MKEFELSDILINIFISKKGSRSSRLCLLLGGRRAIQIRFFRPIQTLNSSMARILQFRIFLDRTSSFENRPFEEYHSVQRVVCLNSLIRQRERTLRFGRMRMRISDSDHGNPGQICASNGLHADQILITLLEVTCKFP